MNPARHTSILSQHEVGVTRRSHEMLELADSPTSEQGELRTQGVGK